MAFFSQNGQVPMEKHPLPPKEETRGKYVFKISFFFLEISRSLSFFPCDFRILWNIFFLVLMYFTNDPINHPSGQVSNIHTLGRAS